MKTVKEIKEYIQEQKKLNKQYKRRYERQYDTYGVHTCNGKLKMLDDIEKFIEEDNTNGNV